MTKPFDVTLKSLFEDAPEDWPLLAGVPEAQVTVIDADIATISGAADKVLRLEGPPAWIMHFEFQSGPDASLPGRANLYSAALENRHQLSKVNVPVAVGVPLITPVLGLRTSPGGNVPVVTTKVSFAVPPLTGMASNFTSLGSLSRGTFENRGPE
jgi:hypothetical protein